MRGTMSHMTVDTRPQRFYYGYIVVGAAFLIMAISSGAIYSFSVFFAPLQSEFEWSRAVTSGAFSSYVIIQGMLSMWTGKLNDRFGPRLILTTCSILFGCGFILMSRIDAVWQLYLLYGVLVAAGFSGAPVPLMSTVARWFRTRRGIMTGIVMAGTGIGTMVMPPFANWLIQTITWRSSFVVVGIMVIAVVMISAQFLRRDQSQLRRDTAATVAIPGAPSATTSGVYFSKACRTKQFWLLILALTGFGFTLQSVMVHVVIHAIGLGVASTTAATIMTAIGGMGVVGRVGVGALADRFGARRLLMLQFVLLALSLFWLTVARDAWSVLGFGFAFGFAYGGIVPLYSGIVADLFGLRAHGAILGTITFSVGIGSAIGPIFTGYCYDLMGTYTISFASCGAVAAVSALLTTFIRPLHHVNEEE